MEQQPTEPVSRRPEASARRIFSEALDKPAKERAAFIAAACGEDAKLKNRVELLLGMLDQAGDLLGGGEMSARDAETEAVPPSAVHGSSARIGRYKLLQLIGEGGFGAVYMAEQEHPVRRRVALKVIKPGMDTKQVIARFEAERQALAMMDHPHIARVFDGGATDAGHPYFVMELVDGVPITRYCDAARLTTRERLDLFVPACQAVQHAHQKGIIHRDLKPSNVLVTMQDGKPVPKVIDFGIAKATINPLTDKTLFTEHRQIIGTPEYMSPEQADPGGGLDVDTRSDVYSLGVLLYELLTGTTPFDPRELRRRAYADIQRVIREVDPPRPSTRLAALGEKLTQVAALRRSEPRRLGALVRGELDWVVMKCLEKDRTRRYEAAAGLAADLRRFLADEPVLARQASAAYRFRKFVRRHRAAAAAVAALAAVLVLGIVGTTAGMLRARAAQKSAEQAGALAVSQSNAAREAQIRAEHNAERAEKVSQFLREVLALAQPETGPGGGAPTVVELLKLAAREVDTRLRGQPEEQILMRTTLAEAFRRLELEDPAVQQLELAHRLSGEQPGGANSPRTLDLTADLVAAMYVAGRGRDAVELARTAHGAASAAFGEDHPVTWKAANALALSLTTVDRADEAHRLWERLVAVVRASRDPAARSPEHAGRYLSNYAASLRDRGRYREALAAVQQASAMMNLAVGDEELTRAAALDDEPGVAAAAARTVIGKAFPDALQSNAWMARLMVEAGHGDAVAPLIERYVNAALLFNPRGTPTLTDRMADLAQLKLRAGDRGAASDWYRRAVETGRRLRPGAGWQDENRWREWVLGCSSLGHGWRSRAWHDHLWCALDDLLRDHTPASLTAQEVDLERVGLKLVRWDGSPSGTVVSDAGLAEFKSLPEPKPGLYLLGISLPRPGAAPLRRASWLPVMKWDLSLHPIPRFESVRTGAGPRWEQDPVTYAAEPYDRRTPAALALNDILALGDEEAPRRLHWFAAVARAPLDLPPGRYRLSASSDDGCRVWVGDRLVIDKWQFKESSTHDAEVTLDAGGADVKVEFFQAVGGYHLWFQVAPRTGAARSAAAALGGGVPEVESAVKLSTRRTVERPEDLVAANSRGHSLCRAGRFDEAAAAFASVMRLAPGDQYAWYYGACLLGYGDDAAYAGHALSMLDRFSGATDVTVCERVVRGCTLRPGPQATDSRLEALRRRMLAPPIAGQNFAFVKLAEGMADYRAGRYDAALAALRESAPAFALPDWATGRTTADLFVAMCQHRLGRHDEARATLAAPLKFFESEAGRPGIDDLITGEPDNWLICHTARREADALINGTR